MNRLHRSQAISVAVCALTVVALSALWRRHPIDDAYITYRYALNLIQGSGFVYNSGEWVLGTTTPLWGLILAAIAALGADLEVASIVGGALSMAASIALFLAVVPQGVSLALLAVWGALIAAYYPLSVVTFSGMETPLYSLVVGMGLFLFGAERYALGGLCAALATLLRPDGFLVIVAGLAAAGRRKSAPALRSLIPYIAVVLPCAGLALYLYGSFVPHSVEAKRLLYASSPLTNALMFFEALSQEPIDAVLLCVGGAGLILLGRERKYRPFAIWAGVYSLGIIASGVRPIFFWYFGPLWLLFATFGVEGLRRMVQEQSILIPRLVIPALCVLVTTLDIVKRAPGLDAVELRENGYREVVSQYGRAIAPGSKVLLGEIGILGYGLMQARVIDSAGIVSPEVSQIVRENRSRLAPYADVVREAPWFRQMVERLSPDWIVGARDRMAITQAENEDWFAKRFTRRAVVAQDQLGGIGVYERAPQP